MTLTDAGPLVALLDADDPYHSTCIAAAQRLPPGPLLTTWVCFTEAWYLLGAVGGYGYQAALWRLRAVGRLALHDLTPAEADRPQFPHLPFCQRDGAGSSPVTAQDERTTTHA